ncbi:putative uncharacterized protein [Parachlamydia acanthamoebae UV-7]|jgi:hypothetical protein|uniref:Immunity protein 53 n=1 Tax=Parachlamydia acanthamoebae (strain UV7) TaxID=765952 RepID=F8KZ23_PARAV|nr:immunity 53 family protein [Parachlamydia acanthamoebae]CCB86146.1 putative uncharacterized protein [Parachlamydia acanthamoebae UV-7]
MKDDFLWILEWYNNQCDGDWEHKCGIHIETIDNPGWSITINFKGTELEGKNFQEIEKDYESANDWLICFVKNSKFEGRCAPLKLPEVLHIFREWVGPRIYPTDVPHN